MLFPCFLSMHNFVDWPLYVVWTFSNFCHSNTTAFLYVLVVRIKGNKPRSTLVRSMLVFIKWFLTILSSSIS